MPKIKSVLVGTWLVLLGVSIGLGSIVGMTVYSQQQLSNKIGLFSMQAQTFPNLITVYVQPNKSREYHIRLNSLLTFPEQYQGVMDALVSTNSSDVVKLYLSGQGGFVDTTIQLASAIKQSKAPVHIIVEGPVYSGHAYLALMGTTVKAMPHTYFMYHHSSGLNDADICSDAKGKQDRGQDAFAKCNQSLKAHLGNADGQLDEFRDRGFLTKAEVIELKKGFDVYITWEEMNKRARASKHGG